MMVNIYHAACAVLEDWESPSLSPVFQKVLWWQMKDVLHETELVVSFVVALKNQYTMVIVHGPPRGDNAELRQGWNVVVNLTKR